MGRLTVGVAHSFASREVFRGPFPFEGSGLALLAGYESPPFGPFTLAIDHFGGASALSASNVALTALVTEGVMIQAGALFAHERRPEFAGVPVDGAFLGVFFTRDVFAHLISQRATP